MKKTFLKDIDVAYLKEIKLLQNTILTEPIQVIVLFLMPSKVENV